MRPALYVCTSLRAKFRRKIAPFTFFQKRKRRNKNEGEEEKVQERKKQMARRSKKTEDGDGSGKGGWLVYRRGRHARAARRCQDAVHVQFRLAWKGSAVKRRVMGVRWGGWMGGEGAHHFIHV